MQRTQKPKDGDDWSFLLELFAKKRATTQHLTADPLMLINIMLVTDGENRP